MLVRVDRAADGIAGEPIVSSRGVWLRLLGSVVVCVVVSCVLAGQALGAQAPRWAITTQTLPANLPLSGGTGAIVVNATNVGGASTSGSTITIGDVLPTSVVATGISGFDAYRVGVGGQEFPGTESLLMTGTSRYAKTVAGSGFEKSAGECTTAPLRCTTTDVVDPGDVLTITIEVKSSAASERSEENVAEVSGGGAASVSAGQQLRFSEASAAFGPAAGSVLAAVSSTQAGAHPDVTTAFAMNMNRRPGALVTAGYPRDIAFELPRGLVGDATTTPRCDSQTLRENEENVLSPTPYPCPRDTIVGMAVLTIKEGGIGVSVGAHVEPVYNIAPSAGEPAAFAVFYTAFGVRLDTSVLSNGNYAVRVSSEDTTQVQSLVSASVTVWGVPSEHSGTGQDRTTVDASEAGITANATFGGPNTGQTAHALLDNPTQCSQAMEASLSMNSWAEPGIFVSPAEGALDLGVPSDCEALSFQPSFTMGPENARAGEPEGYGLELTVPQNEGAEELATSDLKDVSVTLPAGTVIDPSAANGLVSCEPGAFYGPEHGTQTPATAGGCPPESKIGSVEIIAPALSEALHGWVYLGEPECDPCSAQDAENGHMVKLFVEAFDKGEENERVLVKLEGHGYVNQSTGQITTKFVDQPQVPFSNLRLHLFGGPDAPLANPRSCGAYTVGMEATPWSGNGAVSKESSFSINEGCIGSAFAPAFTAGTQNNQAGGYGTFSLGLGREDGEEYLGGVQTTLPPGLLAMISSVSQCAEAQANEGTCPSSSLIGHVSTLVGPGSDPYAIEGGQVYLTGPYEGAPFGLSIVVPASAGPYTLSGTTGKGTVVVRAKIAVNPTTAQATITSNPFPSELDGIPLQIRRVDVSVDREGFMFNATNCSASSVTGTVSSTQGASENVASRYEAANCAALPFKPVFTASTQGSTSKANGASLKVNIGSSGLGQSGIAKVDLTIPKLLPARLTTLQQACTEAQFDANPAGCPTGSDIATVVLHTPILASPLTGPAYFVSHGGAAFPDVEMVLQGEGVTLILDGHTDIKGGVTYSKFETVPDAPFTSFEFNAPEGPHSIFTTENPGKTNLCATSTTKTVTVKKKETKRVHGKRKKVTVKVKKAEKVAQSLTIPTTIVGQNGATITQETKVAVTGCPKATTSAKPAHKKAKKKSPKRGKGRR